MNPYTNMSLPSSSSNAPTRSRDMPKLNIKGLQPVSNIKFAICFDDDNQLIVKEMLVNMMRIPFLVKDEFRNEQVEDLPEMH